MEKQNKNGTSGITLIALVITIILLLILAGVVLNLTLGENGIIKKAQDAGTAYQEQAAREKLELVLLDLQADKVTNASYNENEYINEKIEQSGMKVNGDTVFVDGWQFNIDRTVPRITTSLGKEEIDEDTIINLSLDKEEIIIGITKQANINIDSTAKIKVITEDVPSNKYKWNIQDNSIATIDENGNITAIAGGTTTIECKSINGNKTYATCKLIVEEREYLYYRGNSIVGFDNPICGSQCTISGSPYFMDEYIYSKVSNEKNLNAHQQINYLTSNKIDFSQYKGVVIKKKVNLTGVDTDSFVRPTQNKECNDWGLIEHEVPEEGYGFGWLPTIRGEEEYYDISTYNSEAYLDVVMTVGQYLSGIASVADIYIYEIYLVK